MPNTISGVVATASLRTAESVVKSVSTCCSGLYAMTATGIASGRTLMNARAAAMACSIGSPFMLSDASIRRMTPLVELGASTPI